MHEFNDPPAQKAFAYLTQKQSPYPLWQHGVTVAGLVGLMGGALLAPVPSSWGLQGVPTIILWAGDGVVVLLKALLFSEALFYFLHRYTEHLGVVTRLSDFLSKNQQYHWIHHMIIYPFNKQYKKGTHYTTYERSYHTSVWRAVVIGVVLLVSWAAMGLTWHLAGFLVGVAAYVQVIPRVHDRFHYTNSWEKNKYFQWLSDIHVLHHVDQEKNYTILHPLMDMLFGTYFPPAQLSASIRALLHSNELNFSDFISFSYLVQEATPAHRAAFVSALEQFPGEQKKVYALIRTLEQIPPNDVYYALAIQMKEALSAMLACIQASPLHPLHAYEK